MTRSATATLLLARLALSGQTQAPAGNLAAVTVENFIRAESDVFLGLPVKDGAVGKFHHRRALT